MYFKIKYHLEKSAEYVARELKAYSILVKQLTPEGYTITPIGKGFGQVGIVDNRGDGGRFDLIVEKDGNRFFIEVTGDRKPDDYVYILSEKVDYALRNNIVMRTIFLYEKEKKRSFKVIPLFNVLLLYKKGKIKKTRFAKGERDYYRVPYEYTYRTVSLRRILRYLEQFYNFTMIDCKYLRTVYTTVQQIDICSLLGNREIRDDMTCFQCKHYSPRW